MLSPPSIVSVNSEYLQPLKRKKNRHQEGYFHTYYLNNQQKLLTYSQEYYQVKKLLEPYLKSEKKNVDRHRLGYYQEYEKNNTKRKEYKRVWIAQKRAKEREIFSVKCVVYKNLSHTHIKEHSQEKKELFFVDNTVRKKLELVRRLDQGYLRLPTKNKIPQKRGWNLPWFREWLDKSGLLRKYQEWGIRGGKRIGNKFLSFLDLDVRKEGLEEWRVKRLEKNVRLFLDYLGCFYVETKKGWHVYLLTEELLPNEMIYHIDSWLKKERIIGSIQSKGKYVVGFDSVDKKLVAKGRWFWHVKGLTEIKETLVRFFLKVGREREKKTDEFLVGLQAEIKEKKQNVDNTFNTKKIEVERSGLGKVGEKLELGLRKNLYRVQILSKQKIFCLNDIWKVFYRDNQHQMGYFLVNDYQKVGILDRLGVGGISDLGLVNGFKHRFLRRVF